MAISVHSLHHGIVLREPWVRTWLYVASRLKPSFHLLVTLSALFRLGSKYLSVVPESTWLADLWRKHSGGPHRL